MIILLATESNTAAWLCCCSFLSFLPWSHRILTQIKWGVNKQRDIGKSCKNPRGILQLEYSGWFYISCPVIWKSLFISAFCAYRIIISVETLVKTATHRRCGKVLTNIPTEMDKSSSTKEAISEYRNFDFQFSGSAISSHKNIQK